MTRNTRTALTAKLLAALLCAGGCHLILGLDEFVDAPVGAGGAGGGTATGGGGGTGGTGTAGGGGGPASGEVVWARIFGDENTQTPGGIAVDPEGNVIVAGLFTGTIDFGQGPLLSAGAYDVFLAKLDSEGNAVWSRRFGGAEDQAALAVATDALGNIIVAGTFDGAIDLGGGVFQNEPIQQDVFVVKFDGDANHIWSRHFKGTNLIDPTIAVDPSTAEVVVAGTFTGTIDLGDGAVTTAGQLDMFLLKLSSVTGATLWEHHYGDAEPQSIGGIAVDPVGSTVVAGSFRGALAIDGTVLTNNSPSDDVFAARFDASGNRDWVKRFQSSGHDVVFGVMADEVGAITLAGSAEQGIDFGCGTLAGVGSGQHHVAKLTPVGNCSWSKIIEGSGSVFPVSVVAGPAGETVVAGMFEGMIQGSEPALASKGSFDMFLYGLNAAGEIAWIRAMGNESENTTVAIAVDPLSGAVLLTGYSTGVLDLGSVELSSAGTSLDVVVAKLAR